MSETAILTAVVSGYLLMGLGLLKYSVSSRGPVLMPKRIPTKVWMRR